MRYLSTSLKDAWLVETSPILDSRGKFARFFCQNDLRGILKQRPVCQMNYSHTMQKGSIRGMHFQYPPKAEIKMVRCITGEVFDVMVDLRKNSPTFLKWHGEILSAENLKLLFIPEGFAHGFQTLQPNCELLYLHTEFYSPEHEGGIRYNDSKIGIKWPLKVTEVSDKDTRYPFLTQDFGGIEL
jgi:dTDP-4-dehydrorhamnose 3,5-epimerase